MDPKLLSFVLQGHVYQWNCVTFGWAPATYLAQNMSRFISLCVRLVSLEELDYIPSSLRYPAYPSALTNVFIDDKIYSGVPISKIYTICDLLGAALNPDKSGRQESNVLNYLGVHIDMLEGKFRMLNTKAIKLRDCIVSLLSLTPNCEPNLWRYYLDKTSGKLGFYGLLFERFTGKNLSRLAAYFRNGSYSRQQIFTGVQNLKCELELWLEKLSDLNSLSLDYRNCDLFTHTNPVQSRLQLHVDANTQLGAGITLCLFCKNQASFRN